MASVLGKRARAQRGPWKRVVRRRIGASDRTWETKRKAALALRQTRMLMRQRELKIANDTTTLSASGFTFMGQAQGITVPVIAQGVDNDQRIGLRVTVRWIKVRILVHIPAASENEALYNGFTWQLAIWQNTKQTIRDSSAVGNVAGEYWDIDASGLTVNGTQSFKTNTARFGTSSTLFNRIYTHKPNSTYGNPPEGGGGYMQMVEVFLKPPRSQIEYTTGTDIPSIYPVNIGVISGVENQDFSVRISHQVAYYDT